MNPADLCSGWLGQLPQCGRLTFWGKRLRRKNPADLLNGWLG